MKKLAVVVLALLAFTVIMDFALTGFEATMAKEDSSIKHEIYRWEAPKEPFYINPADNLYQPLALKIAGDIEKQTGISLEKIVEQGGEIIYNFFYTGTSPTVSGECDVVEVIILTEEDKIVEDYVLRYTDEKLDLDSI